MRRVVNDLLRLAASFPSIPVRRRMQLGRLAVARRRSPDRPPWVAIFAKAYGLVAMDMPELRRAYVKLPWPHLYEYRTSMAVVAVERVLDGEPALFFTRVKEPGSLALPLLGETLRYRRDGPIEDISDYRKLLNLARIPWPFRRALMWCAINLARFRATRFGTFGITSVGSSGAEVAHPRGPVTAILTYGPIGDDGGVDVGIVFDHRVMDAAVIARALQRLEQTLNGAVLAELRAGERDLFTRAVAAE